MSAALEPLVITSRKHSIMWKLIVGFALFAAISIYALMKFGGDLDMGGEKHGIEVPAASAPAK